MLKDEEAVVTVWLVGGGREEQMMPNVTRSKEAHTI